MKLSSSEAARAGGVRAARLDRPLVAGALNGDVGYADPRLDEIVRAAAQQAREQARAEGYAAGWAQGRQAATKREREEAAHRAGLAEGAQRELAQRSTGLLAGLASAARAQQAAAVPEWEEVADALGAGALAVAAAALGRELQAVDSVLAEAVRTALRALADAEAVELHLHPADAPLLAGAELPDGVRLVPDPQVPAGAVHAWTPTQRLRVNLAHAVAAAEAVLS
jgi:flagellar assembly protein FliH